MSDTDVALAGLREIAQRANSGYRSVGVMVYEVLRDAILTGRLSGGAKLRQETLAEAIGVSREPVRSALIQLEADGLVELRDRRGAVVKTLSVERVHEIYELRALLEGHALRRAMKSMTPERAARLRDLAIVADAKTEGTDFVSARVEFYRELYGGSQSTLLVEHIEDLRLQLGRYMLGWRVIGEHAHSHQALAEVIAAGDSAAAQKLLKQHLEAVRDGVLRVLAVESGQQSGAEPEA
ncbi:GntR family transcriptional regulator [Lysobacter korlensis]|uniref:GntR family transcriptional regulator n=1 Tax=Lysobacter korlensis TaxID=553636 RepID=A0ABV6RUF2_9GAMM